MEVRQITIHLPMPLLEQLRREAQKRGYGVKDLIVFSCCSYFENIVRE